MKYRSRTEIVTNILACANGNRATKTRIMYTSFLSYAQLKEYLAIVIENGLLSFEPASQTYQTTAKGLQFLKLSEKLGDMFVLDTEKEIAA